jgi:hypothetical protein
MGISALLEVCIGLLFMYLVLSLISTTVHEIIASFLRLRGRALTNTLRSLIDDTDIGDRFFNHGLVVNAEVSSRAGVAPKVEAEASATTGGVREQPVVGDHSSYLNGKNFALALLDSVMKADPTKPFPGVADIEGAVNKLPDSNIRDVLISCLAVGKTDIATLQQSVASWFDSAMGRLSGQYTRSAQKISLLIGVVLAIGLGADSYGVAQKLWLDTGLREELADAAEKFVLNPPASAEEKCKKDADPKPDPEAKPETETTPDAEPKSKADAKAQAEEKEVAFNKCLRDVFNAQMEVIRAFPIGWAEWPKGLDNWLLKILGCLWTGIALSLGAPFWFDLLQKFVSVRAAGTKPPSNPPGTEKS